MAYIKVERSRIFVTAGSFWRSEPAAALRGFAKGARPSSSAAAFKASKLFFGMYTSPRSSSVSTPGAMAPRASSRVRRLYLAQLPHERVEGRVRNGGRVQGVILVAVVLDLAPERLGPRRRILSFEQIALLRHDSSLSA